MVERIGRLAISGGFLYIHNVVTTYGIENNIVSMSKATLHSNINPIFDPVDY